MSDTFNSFANRPEGDWSFPQSGGGQDLPQPGTPQWAAFMAMLRGQGTPSLGGAFGSPVPGPLAANPANLAASPNMANMSVVGLPSSSGFTLPDGTPSPVAADASLVSQGAHPAPPPPVTPPVAATGGKQPDSSRGVQSKPAAKRAPPVGPLAAPQPAGPQGAVDATSPRPSPAASNMPWPNQVDPTGVWGQRPPASGPIDPSIIARQKAAPAVPGAPSNGAVPNLGYYTGPTSGNVQQASSFRYTDPNDPRIYRGPLTAQPSAAAPPAAPAAPGPGPIAPGVGTLWLRKMFPGLQPTA